MAIRFFFFNDTATTEIYTLSLHDALPISLVEGWAGNQCFPFNSQPAAFASRTPNAFASRRFRDVNICPADRKSTRLNSSHVSISYAVFCLKKKKNKINILYYTCQYNHCML